MEHLKCFIYLLNNTILLLHNRKYIYVTKDLSETQWGLRKSNIINLVVYTKCQIQLSRNYYFVCPYFFIKKEFLSGICKHPVAKKNDFTTEKESRRKNNDE